MVNPKIIPIDELKNTDNISKVCKESQAPIIITKNGYGEMVLMSLELYDKTFAKMQEAILINESIEEVEQGATPADGITFFESLRAKYKK